MLEIWKFHRRRSLINVGNSMGGGLIHVGDPTGGELIHVGNSMGGG